MTQQQQSRQQQMMTVPCPRCDKNPVANDREICDPCKAEEQAEAEAGTRDAETAREARQPSEQRRAGPPPRAQQNGRPAAQPRQTAAPPRDMPPPARQAPAGPAPASGRRMSLANVQAKPAEVRFKVGLYGPEGCLAGDTYVQYAVVAPDGRKQNSKGGTIERLYERFHRIPRGGKGFYQRPETEGAIFTAPCMNAEGRICHARVVDVVQSGAKECFRLTLNGGQQIDATEDHPFFNGQCYVPLLSLRPGMKVMVHNGTPFSVAEDGAAERHERPAFYLKSHPRAREKVVAGKYRYRVLLRSHAVVEAEMNGMTVEEFISRCNDEKTEGMRFLGPDDQVHHIDEDVTNDARENLVVIGIREHARLHALERHNNLRFAVIPEEVDSIEPIGVRMTYDLKMEPPFHNFIANGFVAHNCGKTSFGMESPSPIFIAPEWSSTLAKSPTPRLPQPHTFAEVIEALDELGSAPHEYKTLVVDTVDKVQELALIDVVREWNDRQRQDKYRATNIEEVGGGFMKGYVAALDKMRLFISRIERVAHKRDMNVVLLAHGFVRKIKDPSLAEDYEQWDLALVEMNQAPISGLVRNWLDTLLFVNFATKIRYDRRGRPLKRAESPADGNRVLYTQRTAGWRAKNRDGLPTQIPFSWENFEWAMQSSENPDYLRQVIQEKVAELGDPAIAEWVAAELEKGPKVQRLTQINLKLSARLEQIEDEAERPAAE